MSIGKEGFELTKLIRYADEGFEKYEYFYNGEYTPKLINSRNQKEEWICGCFVFVEEVDLCALTMGADYRYNEKRNELIVPDNTLIWTRNILPIIENKKFKEVPYRKIEDYLIALNSWVQMPVSVVAERVRLLKDTLGIIDYYWSEGIY